MSLPRTVLFYAAPPVILGTLFTVYRLWFGGSDEPVPPDAGTTPLAPVEQYDPVTEPFGPDATKPKAPPVGAARPDAGSTPGPAAEAPVHDLASGARLARELAATLYGAFPEVAKWAALPDLFERTVAAADCVAQGGSPRRQLSFLAPSTPFLARQTANGWVVDDASYRRYDRVVGAFCAGDATAVAAAFRRVEPALDLAYRGLGYGEGSARELLGRAAAELLAVPVPGAEVQVVPDGHTYAYADDALQSQSDARKHLLRMGPANIRRVQARIRALASAAGIATASP